MAGILLGRRSALALTLLSIVFGLGLTLLESIGYPLIQYFPVPPLSGWAVWMLTFILILTPLNPTIHRYEQSIESLQDSEEKFRTLLDWTYNWELWVSPQGDLIYCSPSCERITGWTPDDFLSNPDLKMKIVHPDHRNMLREHHQLVHDSKSGPSKIEYKIIARDGSEHWIEHTCRPLFGRNNRYLGCRVSNRDITERKRMDIVLLDSETKFRAIFENSIDAIGVSKMAKHVFVNPAYVALFGYNNSDELIDKPILNLIAPDSREQIIQNVQRRAKGEAVPSFYETRGLRKNGTQFDLEVHVSIFELQDEMFTLVIERDITERKNIMTALSESQIKLSAIFTNSIDSILVAKAGIFVMVNPAFLRLHGYQDISELVGRSVLDLVAPESREMIAENIRRRASGQPTPTFYETLVLKSDGTKFWVELSVSTYELDGEMYALAVERDITERKQVEAALLESKAKYKDLFEHVPVALWDEDFSKLKIYLDKLYQSGITDLRTHFDHNPVDVVHCTELIQIIDVNQATLTLFEAETKEQLLGNLKRIFRYQPPTIIKEEIITLYGGGSPYQGEMLAMSLNGNSFHCHIEVAIAPEYEETWEKVFVSVIDITERKQMEEREHEQRTLAEALSNSAAALNSTLNFDDVLDYIIDNVGRVVPHDAANIMLLDEDNEKLSLVCHRGYVERGAKNSDIEQQFSLVTSLILREVARTGRPVAIPDAHAHPDWISISDTEWVNSYLTAPIQIRQTTVGFLNLDSETTGFFNANHAERLQAFANHAAIAINNAQLYKDMRILAVTDALTGIYNRTFFETELARMELSRDFPVSIIVADLDNLKITNDTFGHTAGDELIKNVSHIFKETFRAADIISRIGGDEFAVLLPNTTSITAEQMLPRIHTKIVQHNAMHPELPIQLSLGTATSEQGQLLEALTLADRRMYADKAKRKSSR